MVDSEKILAIKTIRNNLEKHFTGHVVGIKNGNIVVDESDCDVMTPDAIKSAIADLIEEENQISKKGHVMRVYSPQFFVKSDNPMRITYSHNDDNGWDVVDIPLCDKTPPKPKVDEILYIYHGLRWLLKKI